jgi:soluble lytic murein transglycosylase-like protein/TolA-binding protein
MSRKLGLLIIVFLCSFSSIAAEQAPSSALAPGDKSETGTTEEETTGAEAVAPNPYVLSPGHRQSDTANLYATAVDLMRQRQWGYAIVALSELRKSRYLRTWNYRSMLLLGVALARQGRDQEAVTWLAKAAPVFGSLKADIYLWTAEAHFRLAQYESARRFYGRAIAEVEKLTGAEGEAWREWPDYQNALFKEIECLHREGKYRESIAKGAARLKDYKKRYGEDADFPLTSEVFWLRARSYRKLERFEQEASVLAVIKMAHPECLSYDAVLLRLDALRMQGFAPGLTYDEELVRNANRLRAMWQHGAALDLINEAELLYPPGSEAFDPAIYAKLRFVKARVFLSLGRNTDALEIFDWLTKQADLEPQDAETYLSFLAKAQSRANKIIAAADSYQSLYRSYPQSGQADYYAFMAGWLLAHIPEQFASAEAMLDDFNRRKPRSYLGRKALWFRAWFAYRAGLLDKASDLMSRLYRDAPRGEFGEMSRYWLGRIAQKKGDVSRAKSFYLTLAPENGSSYYQLLAQSRLKQMLVMDPQAPLPQPLEPDLIDPIEATPTGIEKIDSRLTDLNVAWSEFRRAEQTRPRATRDDMRTAFVAFHRDLFEWAEKGRSFWSKELATFANDYKAIYPDLFRAITLSDLGFEEEANVALGRFSELRHNQARKVTSGLPGESGPDREALIAERIAALGKEPEKFELDLLRQFVLTDDLAQAFRLYARDMGSGERAFIPWDLRRRLFFPMVYDGAVWAAADEHGIEDEVIYAVMRTESYFNPRATSVVNAMGLMQIMPHTGLNISRRLGDARFSRTRLYEPGTAVRYGAWYLAQLVQKFDGQLPLAIASYNGGPHNVITWLDRNPNLEWDEFIESIEFAQTRDYVKKVLRYAAIYRELYGGRFEIWDFSKSIQYRYFDNIDF